jgi:hypothetical protein
MDGRAYREGDALEVYLKVDGKWVKLTGNVKDAKRHFGRLTRESTIAEELGWPDRSDNIHTV